MSQTLMTYTQPVFLVADTQAALDAGDAYECQINVATIDPSITFATVPSTGCSGPSQSPSAAAWALTLTWLQDWSAPGGGLSGWSYTNRLTQKWFRLIPNKTDVAVQGEGVAWIVPGRMGGTFGDGSTGQADAVWQLIGDPTFDFPGMVAATGATAGIPGTWTPGGSTPPANAAGATSDGVTASPATAWTAGQYVQGSTAGTPGQMHWSGSAWVAGIA